MAISSTAPAPCPKPRDLKVREEVYRVPCGSRYCSSCGLRWAADQRVVAVAASEWIDGDVALVTATAPGRIWFGADAASKGCSRATAMHLWNRDARVRFRRWWIHATAPLRRWQREHAPAWGLLYRAWEFQKRGALHAHLVLPMRTPEERRVTRLAVWNLWSTARRFGFGYVLGGDSAETPTWDRAPSVPSVPGGRAARYVAKYVSGATGGKQGMASTVRRIAQRGSVLYVSQRLTAASEATMTALRARRRIYSRWPWAARSAEAWRTAQLLDGLQRGRPPLSPEAVASVLADPRVERARSLVDADTGEEVRRTKAPPARGAVADYGSASPLGERVAVRLASVRLPDPQRPWLGPIRTAVQVVG